MRPVIRGEIPKNEDGSDYIPDKYQKYRGHLIERLGKYCSYCERPMSHSIAVEHIQPKSKNRELEVTWSNLLICCANCNPTKGDMDVALEDYFWPDIDNTSRAFIYSVAGSIHPNENLEINLRTKASKTIALTGLDKQPSEDLGKNPEVRDLRWSERKKAWEKAKRAKINLCRHNVEPMRKQIIDTATSEGFFSIWMTVFYDDIEMKTKLINSFKGTDLGCYDENINPIPRQNGLI